MLIYTCTHTPHIPYAQVSLMSWKLFIHSLWSCHIAYLAPISWGRKTRRWMNSKSFYLPLITSPISLRAPFIEFQADWNGVWIDTTGLIFSDDTWSLAQCFSLMISEVSSKETAYIEDKIHHFFFYISQSNKISKVVDIWCGWYFEIYFLGKYFFPTCSEQ